jgi:LAS superfamily LD-carboxypeptidase LdcB
MQDPLPKSVALVGVALFFVLVGTTLAHVYSLIGLERLERSMRLTESTLTALTASVASTSEALDARLLELNDRLYAQERTVGLITENIEGFSSEVGQLSGSVKTLEKLTTTDPELLQKYSKVYFLNEHYTPADLAIIKEEYDLVNGKEVSIHAEVLPFLHDLLRAAEGDGIPLMVLSGYRSYDEQESLKGAYTVRYGTGANQFSADQGYSEHQLGTAVDFTTKDLGENLAGFGGTEAFRWLTEHAYRYGFVLSYPEGNTYYQYEPWHWRFVGKPLASYLHKKELRFYDMEQREIDAYIPTFFDE